MSKSQIERLGQRLVVGAAPSTADVEILADRVGRGIRYGQTPATSAEERQELDASTREMFDGVLEWWGATVAKALAFANMIEGIEVAEQVDPQAPELVALRLRARAAVADLQKRP